MNNRLIRWLHKKTHHDECDCYVIDIHARPPGEEFRFDFGGLNDGETKIINPTFSVDDNKGATLVMTHTVEIEIPGVKE